MSKAEDDIRDAFATVRRALRKGWKGILLAAALGGVLTTALSLVIPPSYVARVLLLPMEQGPSTSLRGIASSLADLYMGGVGETDVSRALPDIIGSRSYLERLVATDVRTVAGPAVPLVGIVAPRGTGNIRMAKAVKRLGKRLDIAIDRRTGAISLRARFEDPQVAADVANSGATMLQEVISDLFTSQASQERRFLEGRIEDTQRRLQSCEEELTMFRSRNVRVGSARLQLEENRLARAVREQEQVYLTLREQYELARISETRRIPSIRIADSAVPPIEHDWPPRRLFALGGLALGGVWGTVASVRRQRRILLQVAAAVSPSGA